MNFLKSTAIGLAFLAVCVALFYATVLVTPFLIEHPALLVTPIILAVAYMLGGALRETFWPDA